MTTSPSTDYVTKAEFEHAMDRIDTKFDHLEARFDAKLEILQARLDARIEQAMVTGIRWTVGVSFSLYALMFGLVLFIVSREFPHA